jgi:hypothetical protein
MSSGYRKFSSRFASYPDRPKTFASFATFADGGRNFEAEPDTEKTKIGTPKIQSGPVKVAQVAKVEAPEAVCAVCGAADDLWHLDTPAGTVSVHPECAEFLPKPDPAMPTAAYQGVTAEPGGVTCKVTIVEIPAIGLRYRKAFGVLQLHPPAMVDVARWQQCIEDGRRFFHQWGEQAQALNWSRRDLFGLHTPPANPHPSYRRLSRYDCTGLCWLLEGREVVALTEATATIRNPVTGTVTTYSRHLKPALGPLGDSLEDLK